MSHNRSSGFKTFQEKECKDMQVNLSCPDNDVGNYFVHCDIGLMPEREVYLYFF